MPAERTRARPQLMRRARTTIWSWPLFPSSFCADTAAYADSINRADRQQFVGDDHPGPELSLAGRTGTSGVRPSKAGHDPALPPAQKGRELGSADAVPHLVRDRSACGRRHGRAGIIPKAAAKAIWDKGKHA